MYTGQNTVIQRLDLEILAVAKIWTENCMGRYIGTPLDEQDYIERLLRKA